MHVLLIYHVLLLIIGFDLNLPLDEFGAVDFDYVQNLAGKHAYIPVDFFHYKIMLLVPLLASFFHYKIML
jgi:hypothetical protein